MYIVLHYNFDRVTQEPRVPIKSTNSDVALAREAPPGAVDYRRTNLVRIESLMCWLVNNYFIWAIVRTYCIIFAI